MKRFKLWYVSKMIALCNYALRFSDQADDQQEINEVIKTKNYFLRQLDILKSKA